MDSGASLHRAKRSRSLLTHMVACALEYDDHRFHDHARIRCHVYDTSTIDRASLGYYTFSGGSLATADVTHFWLAEDCPVGKPAR
jgi:hypothetical protein